MRSTRAAESRAPPKHLQADTPCRLRPCPVIRNASKEHASAADFLGICKPSLPHEAKDSALGIIFHAVAGVEQVGEEAMRAILPAFEVEHVKLAAGFDHAPNRTQGLPFFVRREVVEHKRRKYAIEPRLGIRKLVSKSLIELDGDPCARRLASGAGKSLGVGIESDHFDVRIKLLDQRGQSARAAAHVENALTRPQRRLLEQRLPSRVTAKQLHYRIVERQRPIVSSRREISSRRFHHGFYSYALVSPPVPLSCAFVIPPKPLSCVLAIPPISLSFRGAKRRGICCFSLRLRKKRISRSAGNDNNNGSLKD